MKKLLVILVALISCHISAQTTTSVYFHLDKKSEKFNKANDSVTDQLLLSKAIINFKLLGYVGLSVLDTTYKKKQTHYWLTYQRRFKKVVLLNINETIKTSLTETYLTISKQLINLEDTGFPFAKLKITKQSIDHKNLVLTYEIDSGEVVVIDKIHLKSKDEFNEKTILNILNLRVGERYNESKIRAISALLEASNIYKAIRSPQLIFKKGKAEVYIYIERLKSSSADGYVGLQQNIETGKLQLNGYLNLQLSNGLNRGEFLNLNWKSNPDKTQNLKFNFEYPYIFNSPIGIESNVNLQKQDTSFLTADLDFGLNYIQPYFKIGLYNQFINSTVLDKTVAFDVAEFSKNIIGLNLVLKPQFYSNLSFYKPKLTVKGGFYSYESDSIETKRSSSNYTYAINMEQKFKFLTYFSFNNQTGFNGLNASYNLARNELVYFGGLKSVRGFYELELTGNEVFTVLNEIEFQPISVLSFKLIYDYSQFKFNGNNHTNSLGIGFGLINENSILEISIANGVLNSNQIDFNTTKIHIGFKASF
jgi:hemolysin activation/secretion protein